MNGDCTGAWSWGVGFLGFGLQRVEVIWFELDGDVKGCVGCKVSAEQASCFGMRQGVEGNM